MQKFLKYFGGACAVILGVYSLVIGVQQILSWTSSSQEDLLGYAQKIDPIALQTSQIMNKIAPLFDNPNESQNLLSEVTSAKNQFISLERKAKEVQPPKDLKDLHQDFVESIGLYRSAFTLTEEGLQQNDLSKTDQAADLLVKGANQLQQVSKELVELSRK